MIDAGNMINSCAVAALYAADTIFLVTNPDVPSIRNSQRLSTASGSLAPAASGSTILLNRVSDQHLIAPKQIETALGYGIVHMFTSDYRRFRPHSTRRPPRADEHSEISMQFGSFTVSFSAFRKTSSRNLRRRKAFLGILDRNLT